jgi:hypothetical protein
LKRLAVGAVVLALAGSGCENASEHKAEAAAVNHAVTSLREADNAKKREFLGALRETACTTPDVCAVRSACLAAYELHVSVTERVKNATVGDGEHTDPAALTAMKQDLTRSLELSSKCTDAQGEMIRRYKL